MQLSTERDVIMELKPIGQAELQNEIQKIVKMISDRRARQYTTKTSLELDEAELKNI